jgi:hypothetical protein
MLYRLPDRPFVVTKQPRFQDHHRNVTSQHVIGQFDREIPTFLRVETVNVCKLC